MRSSERHRASVCSFLLFPFGCGSLLSTIPLPRPDVWGVLPLQHAYWLILDLCVGLHCRCFAHSRRLSRRPQFRPATCLLFSLPFSVIGLSTVLTSVSFLFFRSLRTAGFHPSAHNLFCRPLFFLVDFIRTHLDLVDLYVLLGRSRHKSHRGPVDWWLIALC